MAIITAMNQEMRPLVRAMSLRRFDLDEVTAYRGNWKGRSIVAVVSGMGMAPARRATELAIESAGAERVLMVGIAGAVEPGLAIGSLVVPEVVIDADDVEYLPTPTGTHAARGAILSTDELLADPTRIADLDRRGIVAVDMETAAVGAVCRERGLDWSVFRAISDRAGDPHTDDGVVGLAHGDGSADIVAVLRYVGRHPGRVPHLARLARGSRVATLAASAAAIAWLSDPSGR